MEAGQISIGGNGAFLPESSPENSIGQNWVAPAGGINVKLGLTDNLEFRAETWIDLNTSDAYSRGTSSFSLLYHLNNANENWEFYVMPRYGFVNVFQVASGASFNFNGIQGHGLSLSLAAKRNTDSKIKPYFGLSGLIGFADWQASRTINSNGNYRNRNGQALVFHGGMNMKLNEYLSFNAEMPLLFQMDQFNEKFYIFPTINMGLDVSLGNLW